MIWAEYSSSGTAMTLTSEVIFSMPMNSLPVGGMMTPHGLRQDHPEQGLQAGHAQGPRRLALALDRWMNAGPDNFRHVGRFIEPEAEDCRGQGV